MPSVAYEFYVFDISCQAIGFFCYLANELLFYLLHNLSKMYYVDNHA